MANWKYRLEYSGKNLRNLINDGGQTLENIVAIYNQIITCLEYLQKRLTKSDIDIWKDEIENMIEELRCECPDLQDESLEYADEEENLNYHLRDFYDLCDAARVWIGV